MKFKTNKYGLPIDDSDIDLLQIRGHQIINFKNEAIFRCFVFTKLDTYICFGINLEKQIK